MSIIMKRSSSNELSKILKQIHDEHQRDFQEKDDFHRLNQRLNDVLIQIENLQEINEKLENELKNEIVQWPNLTREDIFYIFNVKTDDFHRYVDEQNASICFRLASIFVDVEQIFRRHEENLRDHIDENQRKLNEIEEYRQQSDDELKSLDNDLNDELVKFRRRFDDWKICLVEKEFLNVEIQTLRERILLINALNNEEIDEWKRLLIRSNDESQMFYRQQLTDAIQDVRRDFVQRTKSFQNEIESKFEMIENLSLNNDFVVEPTSTFDETKFISKINQFEKEQMRINDLTSILSNKRRLLRDEQSKFDEIQRRIRTKYFDEQNRTNELRRECSKLRQTFEQMAVELRFSIEDELQIYSHLLNGITTHSETMNEENSAEIDETFEGFALIFQ